MTEPKIDVSEFGPKLMAALLAAAKGDPLELPCQNQKEAVRLVQRFNQLRQRMKATQHPDYKAASQVSVSRDDNVVRLRRRDSEFDHVFEKAKIDVPKLDKDPLEEI
jgi:hypothetical protein